MPSIFILTKNILFPFAFLFLFGLSVYGWGSVFINLFRGQKQTSSILQMIYSCGLGFGLVGHAMLLLGSLRLFTPTWAWLVILVGLILGVIDVIKKKGAVKFIISKIRHLDWFCVVLIILIGINLFYSLSLNPLVPTSGYDELAYHLAIPKIFIQHEGLSSISFIPYSNWPLETEMLFTLSLLLSSERLASLISWFALILIVLTLSVWGFQRFGKYVGLLAAAIFSVTPIVLKLAGTTYIEIPLALFTLLATLPLLDWLESGQKSDWILSAVFGGLAASTKLNAALVPLVLGSVMAVSLIAKDKSGWVKALKYFALYGVIAFCVVAPWYIKTLIQTGNPFWPFLYNLFGGRNWDELGTHNLLAFIRITNMPYTLKNYLLGVWYMTIDPYKFGPWQLGWLYIPFLLIALPPLLFESNPDRRSSFRWLGLFALLYYTLWFFQTHQTRFLVPALPIFALLAAGGLQWFWQLFDKRWGVLVQMIVIALLGYSFWSTALKDREIFRQNISYLTGKISREKFLQSRLDGTKTYNFINHNLPENARIWMALWESRGYYLDREYEWANPISQRSIKLEQFSTEEQLLKELKLRGFTHVLYAPNYNDQFLWIPNGQTITSLVDNLIKNYTRQIYSSGDISINEIP